ncbi:hypothetical protein D3C78_1863480 [compost metagenome]
MPTARQDQLLLGQIPECDWLVKAKPRITSPNQHQALHHHRHDTQRVQWLQIIGDGQVQLAALEPVHKIAAEGR